LESIECRFYDKTVISSEEHHYHSLAQCRTLLDVWLNILPLIYFSHSLADYLHRGDNFGLFTL
jgi:hypothetical protein